MSERTMQLALSRATSASDLRSQAREDAPVQYILGHSPDEIRRLIQQAAILRPITERLFRSAGIGPGMRVLDLGCGAGDVSFLAADLVGASGSVVGIDQNPDVVAFARERARSYELPQVTFRDVALEAFSDAEPFDAVIGRYVLVHQSDPNAFLRAAADCVRRGGVLAFHELDLVRGVVSLPSVPLWNAVTEMILTAFRATLVHGDVGGRLIEHFFDAGLPSPNLFGELLIGGGEQSPLYSWIVESLRSVQPQLVKMGIVTADGLPLATLEASLRKSVVEARSQIIGPAQICAWTQLPA